jgi:hypothetical protein
VATLGTRLGRLARRLVASTRHAERGTGRTTRRTEPTTAPVPHGLQVEYAPHLDGDPDPGEVVWAWVPFEEDPTLGKDRPVVVLGRSGGALAGVALTSRARQVDWQVPVGSGAWDRTGRPSYAIVDRLLRIDPAAVRREGAALERRRFDQVVDGVARRYDVRR